MDAPVPITEPTAAAARGAVPRSRRRARFRQRLRGRWRWVLLSALVLACLGAGAGYLTGQTFHLATAVLTVTSPRPAASGDAERQRVHALAAEHVERQIELIRSPAVAIAALRDPAWPNSGAPQTVESLTASLTAASPPAAPHQLAVTLTGTDRAAAAQALTLVVKAYAQAYVAEQREHDAREVAAAAERERAAKALAALQAGSDTLRRVDGYESVAAAIAATQAQLASINAQVAEKQVALASALPDGAPTTEGLPPHEQLERMARTDPELSLLLDTRARTEVRLAELRRRMGPSARDVVEARDSLAVTDAAIANRLRARTAAPAGDAPTSPASSPLALTEEELRRQVERLTQLRERLTGQLADLQERASRARSADAEIADAQATLATAEAALDRLVLERRIAGPLDTAAGDDVALDAAPHHDTRPRNAAIGAAAGLLAGLLGVPMLLTLDKRMRRPDSADLLDPGIPLYGSVPQVAPDELGDSADLTALAIHEIRGLMQIRARHDGAKAFAITSPSRGSGKTSLTVGLASSLALSGTRTLLVDCDLAGRVAAVGGSRRPKSPGAAEPAEPAKQNLDQVMLQMGYLDENDPEVFLLSHDASVGITGMLEGASLAQCVIDTSVPNLAVLPALSATQHHIGRMSGQFIRRLIDEASTMFDLIVFDTGPIPGSVEALFVTSEADATILVTSRGENQDRFDRTVAYLKVVGAKLAGTVFNRAERDDLRIQGIEPPRPKRRRGTPEEPPVARKAALPTRQLAGSGLLALAVHQQADRAIGESGGVHASREEATRRRRPPKPTGNAVKPPEPSPRPDAAPDNRNAEIAGLLGEPAPAPPSPGKPRPTPRPAPAKNPPRNGATQAFGTDDDLEEALDELVNEVRITERPPTPAREGRKPGA